jgi:LPS sulfotransferase NodH
MGKKIMDTKQNSFQLEEQYSDIDKIRDTFLTGAKIIFLKRDNYIRQAISVFIGVQRGKWHDKKENSIAGQKFNINPVMLHETVRRIDTYYIRKEKLLRGIDHLFINYERDLLNQENHQRTME